jgi:hypothetical protein
MDSRSGDGERSDGSLLPILMANAICWAVALIASVVLLHGTGYDKRMLPILAAGANVALVAVGRAWRRRRRPCA